MAAAVQAASKIHSHERLPPRRWCQPSTLTATACVFELIETTTSALVVKKNPVVDVGAARHREALRCATHDVYCASCPCSTMCMMAKLR